MNKLLIYTLSLLLLVSCNTLEALGEKSSNDFNTEFEFHHVNLSNLSISVGPPCNPSGDIILEGTSLEEVQSVTIEDVSNNIFTQSNYNISNGNIEIDTTSGSFPTLNVSLSYNVIISNGSISISKNLFNLDSICRF
jgi:hypothetical protein